MPNSNVLSTLTAGYLVEDWVESVSMLDVVPTDSSLLIVPQAVYQGLDFYLGVNVDLCSDHLEDKQAWRAQHHSNNIYQ